LDASVIDGKFGGLSERRPIRVRARALVALPVVAACVALLLLAWRGSATVSAAPPAAAGNFAGLVEIDGGRELQLACRGSGGPTVVLISGFRGAEDDWTHVVPRPGDEPRPSRSSVFPQVGGFTRVCAYDRPGTTDFDGVLTPSTPVRQPTTAEDGSADLHALLGAAGVAAPYLLVAHSWGGMIAVDFASEHPEEVASLVLVDPGSVYLKSSLRPAQWERFVAGARRLGTPRTLEAAEYERSVAAIRAAPAPPRIPAVVLTSDHRFDFGAGGAGTWPAWLNAQNRLAASLDARHVTHTDSGHYIAGERPRLVIGAVRRIVRTIRAQAP
jgi:pimeloyl-ACP methyl ester carboxylesterase